MASMRASSAYRGKAHAAILRSLNVVFVFLTTVSSTASSEPSMFLRLVRVTFSSTSGWSPKPSSATATSWHDMIREADGGYRTRRIPRGRDDGIYTRGLTRRRVSFVRWSERDARRDVVRLRRGGRRMRSGRFRTPPDETGRAPVHREVVRSLRTNETRLRGQRT